MARIISSRKKYVPVKDLVVYPSKTETIEVIPDDGLMEHIATVLVCVLVLLMARPSM